MTSPFAAFAKAPAPIKFETFEHRTIGENLFLQTPNGVISAKEYIVATINGIELNIGQVLSLAGDFYTATGNNCISDVDYANSTPPGKSVSEPQSPARKRAKDAAATLRSDVGGYLGKLIDFNKREAAAVKKALKEGIPAAIAYRDKLHGMPTNTDYTLATKTLYARIGWYNFDHFSPNSRQAYAACHSNAIEIAAEAGKNEERLKEAYYMEGWALHFLTDAFSSGHLRVPRRELHDDNRVRAWTGGPLEIPVWDIQAGYMHDEDSACGLLVRNEEGGEWIAFGDKEFFGGHNLINRLHCERAAQASIDEVYAAFESGTKIEDITNYQFMKLEPKACGAVYNHDPKELNLDVYDNFPQLWSYDKNQEFRCRLDKDDHANFQYQQAHPGYEISQWLPGPSISASSIKQSSYRQKGMYPPNIPISLSSGGFLQIQNIITPNNSIYSTNIFGPISLQLSGANAALKTFSLRNRTRQFLTLDKPTKPISWSKHFHPITGKTFFILFSHSGNNTQPLEATVWSFTSDPTSQDINFDDLDSTPLTPTQDFPTTTLIPKFPGPGLPCARYLLTPWSSPTDPDIITVTFSSNTTHQPRITIHRSLPNAPGTKYIPFLDHLDTQAPSLPWSHTKFLFLSSTEKRLIITSPIATAGQDTKLYIRSYNLSDVSGIGVTESTITLEGVRGDKVRVMTGDVIGEGRDQMVVVAGEGVWVYRVEIGAEGLVWSLVMDVDGISTRASGENGMLVDNESRGDDDVLTALWGESVLSISAAFVKGKRMLQFLDRKKGGVGVVSRVMDELWDEKHFKSVRWFAAGDEAVVEVFGYYGMLGMRTFMKDENAVYRLSGLCGSLGQPNTTVDGGILEWGPSKGFGDVDYF
ncbi:hypothetical protein BZA77DRAFT_388902 [Pyronema omphalodes]|nr:hypothetical protein BZA77DRAFT_388902 [Pyronema omphalodes]